MVDGVEEEVHTYTSNIGLRYILIIYMYIQCSSQDFFIERGVGCVCMCVCVCVSVGRGFFLVSKFNTQCICNTNMYYMQYKCMCTSIQKYES